MVGTLLTHGWKKFTRSAAFSKDIVVSIFLGLMTLMMIIYSLALGVSLDSLITETLKKPDSFIFLNMLLLYYFVVEFVMRYMIQNVPVLDIQSYMHLPVNRSRIMNFLLVKSLIHVLNLSVLLLFAPFAFQVVAAKFGIAAGWNWLISIWVFSLCMHYIVILFKKKLEDSIWGILIIVTLFAGLAAADYYAWFRLSDISKLIFSAAARHAYVLLALFCTGALLYYFNLRFFISGVYADEQVIRKSVSTKRTHDFSFLKSFGAIGDLINLEIKLILRNKRPRTVLLMTFLFMLYGLLFYTRDIFGESQGMLLFVGLLITGIFMMNYGQFLFSWQANHFDFTLTRPVSLSQYIESKYWLLNIVTLFCFLLSIPYAYFGWNIVLANAALMLFNMGVNVYIVMNMAMWGPKKLNLTKGGTLNYEGLGAAQWVMGIPIMASPYVIYLPFSIAGYPNLGLIALASVGLLGLILRPYLLTLTTQRMQKLKYSIAEGFRNE